MVNRIQRNEAQQDDYEDPLPAGTEHVVVLHNSISVSAADVLEHDPETAEALGLSEADAGPRAGGGSERVYYEPGDELPVAVARRVWSGLSDLLAALDANGERLDRPSRSEARDDIDADSALAAWRRQNGLRRVTRQVYVCEECGETFDTVQALNGHQSAHTEGETGRPPAGADTLAERMSDGEATESGGAATDGGEGA